ncbi:Cof-type HAD-IIB family hydrolase [Bacillus massilinigeriensis]|uniref:Cof-type HAD-IIB family hydrolase n=1 Tax=Bacillus massilionigeriensis TaxID=1805475 RepID=UPI00096B5069|nr:Cof-type HAD-IIB family hydrolase [Bacillus massilionigeriensis]
MLKLKAVFSDIDGTLLNSNHQITSETKKEIIMVVKNNVPFVLVSARMPRSILQIQKELSIDSPIICYSGALVLGANDKNGQRKIIDSTSLSKEDVKEIFNIINTLYPTISSSLYSHDQWVVNDNNNEWIIQEKEITNIIPIQRDFLSFIEETTDFHKCLCMGEPNVINQLESTLKERFPNLNIYKSKDTYLEIMPGNASKSNAIKKLENLYHFTSEEIMAVGDNFNDMDMLKYAGLGIAMGNSPDEVKTIADEVTFSNDEDGLKYILQKYFG